jgi:tRNA-dihydrouridine synthase B
MDSRGSSEAITVPGTAIGSIDIGRLGVLAPLAGYTDLPFRKLLSIWGAGLYFTEMISARAAVLDCRKTMQLASGDSESQPLCAQIFGSVPEYMAKAAAALVALGNVDVIDVNMGCPVRKIVSGGAGSALMKTPDTAVEIVRAVREAVSVPVTVKMRSGWDSDSINAPELAGSCVAAGADAVYIHPRTRSQMFAGQPDWSVARSVVQAVNGKVPVFANGNIDSYQKWNSIRELTGCESCMIGRGALGAPWIFQEIKRGLPSGTIAEIIGNRGIGLNLWYQLLLSASHYGERGGIVHMRKQSLFFARGFKGAKSFRTSIMSVTNLDEAAEAISGTFDFYWEK